MDIKDQNKKEIKIESDEDLSGAWIMEIIQEFDIPYKLSRIEKDYLYELTYIPSEYQDQFYYKYVITYDEDDPFHQFAIYIIKKCGEKILALEDNINADEIE